MTEKLSCSDCHFCCLVLEVEEISKPFCVLCPHVKKSDKGCCSIYETRPTACADFRCLWLQSQDRPGQEMPIDMRPNHSKVMFNTSPENNKHIYAHVHPHHPDAWKKGGAWAKIQDLIDRGGTVEVVIGEWRNLLRAGKPTLRFHESVIDKMQKENAKINQDIFL